MTSRKSFIKLQSRSKSQSSTSKYETQINIKPLLQKQPNTNVNVNHSKKIEGSIKMDVNETLIKSKYALLEESKVVLSQRSKIDQPTLINLNCYSVIKNPKEMNYRGRFERRESQEKIKKEEEMKSYFQTQLNSPKRNEVSESTHLSSARCGSITKEQKYLTVMSRLPLNKKRYSMPSLI